MSSPTSSDAASSATSTSPSQFTSSTNYFYGFLIAFLCFLAAFGGLHFVARRRRARLMRNLLLYGPDYYGDGVGILQTEPVLWEPSYAEARGQLWGNILPLSTTLVQREVTEEKVPPGSSPPPPTRNPLVAFFGFLPVKPLRTAPRKTKVTEGMNIAVMINMPQVPEALKDEDIPEYQIGTLQLPWNDENLSQTP
ncbi:hypothetical protein DFH09DRAFT_1135014 [Mycena vulgaris]|nr:hypothetical protein DFH09DRAFT_1135014 [Mycena vulgaris]